MGGAVLAGAAGIVALSAQKAAAEVHRTARPRRSSTRHLIVGTGSTNAPWHFEDEAGKLVGMDITMAKILAKGLFDDETKVEYVLQDPAQRIPNIVTGKVNITDPVHDHVGQSGAAWRSPARTTSKVYRCYRVRGHDEKLR